MGPIVLLFLFVIIGGAAGVFSAFMVASLRHRIERLEHELRSVRGEQPPAPPAEERAPRPIAPPAQGPSLPLVVPPAQGQPLPPVAPPVPPAIQPQSTERAERALGRAPIAAPPPWVRPEGAPPRVRTPEEALRAKQWWKGFEEALGTRWTTWVGAIVLFLGAGFFVKYAFDHEWLDPSKRVILAVALGLVLVGAGVRFVRRAMRALGQGLIGAGLAVIYTALYAAFGYYEIISWPVAFTLMALVTAGGMTLACVLDAVAISFLAVLGGCLTPILLRTGADARDTLFGYLVVLDLGVLGVAVFKRWRALDVLAFTGTWALFSLWYFGLPARAAVVPTMLWLGIFYIVFLLQPVVYHWRGRTQITGERFALAMVHATIVFSFAYGILYHEPNAASGLVSLAMGFCYLVFAAVTRMRVSADRRAVFGFIALAIIFLTLAAPIFFDFYAVTIAWAIEGAVLVYLGYRFTHALPRVGGIVVLVLSAGRFFVIHWPLHAAAFTPVFNTAFGSAAFVALAGAAYALVHHSYRREASATDSTLKLVSAIGAGLFALVMIHVEVWQYLAFKGWADAERWAAALVWTAGAVAYLGLGFALRSTHARVTGMLALGVSLFLIVLDYGAGTKLDGGIVFNGRYAASVFVVLVLFAYAFATRRARAMCTASDREGATLLCGSAIVLLAALSSFEVVQWLTGPGQPYWARCLVTLIWVAASMATLYAGVKLRSLPLCSTGTVVLTVAGIAAIVCYAHEIAGSYLIGANGRFAAALSVVLALFVHAGVLRRFRGLFPTMTSGSPTALSRTAIVVLLVLLSVETHLYFAAVVNRGAGARGLAQMALSVLWGVYASGLLAAGFVWKDRVLRFMALGLFGLACLKLIAIDMANVRDLYRIISSFVLGLLIIGASYLYHRIEKRIL